MLECLDSFFDQRSRFFGIEPVAYVHFFSFEVFVGVEEIFDLQPAMVLQLAYLFYVVDHGVVIRDTDDLQVVTFVVVHFQPADRVDANHDAGLERLVAKDEYIERIAVAAQRARDKAIGDGIVDRREEYAVEFEDPKLGVVFDLVARAPWDFDDGIYDFRRLFADWQILKILHELSCFG